MFYGLWIREIELLGESKWRTIQIKHSMFDLVFCINTVVNAYLLSFLVEQAIPLQKLPLSSNSSISIWEGSSSIYRTTSDPQIDKLDTSGSNSPPYPSKGQILLFPAHNWKSNVRGVFTGDAELSSVWVIDKCKSAQATSVSKHNTTRQNVALAMSRSRGNDMSFEGVSANAVIQPHSQAPKNLIVYGEFNCFKMSSDPLYNFILRRPQVLLINSRVQFGGKSKGFFMSLLNIVPPPHRFNISIFSDDIKICNITIKITILLGNPRQSAWSWESKIWGCWILYFLLSIATPVTSGCFVVLGYIYLINRVLYKK